MEEVENPHILYSLPRSQSTVILEASKKTLKLNEPFSKNSIKLINTEERARINELDCRWKEIEYKINEPTTIVKFLPRQLMWISSAKEWFYNAKNTHSHTIFVTVRDLSEMCWSTILAAIYGWNTTHENYVNQTEKHVVPQDAFVAIEEHISCFIEHFPENAILVSLDNLPSKYFDANKITMEKQNTMNKLDRIINYEYCDNHIKELVQIYQPTLNHKISTLTKLV